jgi:hypothetical protein
MQRKHIRFIPFFAAVAIWVFFSGYAQVAHAGRFIKNPNKAAEDCETAAIPGGPSKNFLNKVSAPAKEAIKKSVADNSEGATLFFELNGPITLQELHDQVDQLETDEEQQEALENFAAETLGEFTYALVEFIWSSMSSEPQLRAAFFDSYNYGTLAIMHVNAAALEILVELPVVKKVVTASEVHPLR